MTPAMLIDLLNSFRGRLRRLSIVYGLGLVLALIAIVFCAMSLLDFTFHLSQIWRAIFLAAAVGILSAAAFRHLLTPMQSRLPMTDIAGRIERRFPQFQDRLRSAVGFIDSPTADSPTMQRATIDQAVNLASSLPLRDVIDPRPALRSFAIGLATVCALFVGVLMLEAGTRSVLLSRVLNPFSDVQWPKRVKIALLDPIPTRVPANGRVNVAIRLDRGESARIRPIVFYQSETGAVRQEFLSRGEDGRYTASLDARTESPTQGGSMNVWIVAGDDRTPDATIEIVPRLGVETVAATVAPPAYVGDVSPTTVNLLNQQASGLVGSTLDMTIGFSKPVADVAGVKLIPMNDAAAPVIEWTAVDARTIRGAMRLDTTLEFRVDAKDADGFEVASQSTFSVIARPDQLPAVFIENPRRNEERTPDATIPLVGVAEDDAGIRDVSLVVKKLGQSEQGWTIPLIVGGSTAPNETALSWARMNEAADRDRFRAEYAWTLSSLTDAKLKSGDVLEYGLTVTDNYELDGNRHPPVESSKLLITIISQEEFTNRVTDELRQVKTQLTQIKQQQDRTSAETDSFKQDVNDKASLDEADVSVATRLQQQQSSVASATMSLSDRLSNVRKNMDENKSASADLAQVTKDVSERLTQTAEGPMKASLRKMGSAAQQQNEAPSRAEALEQAGQAQQQASSELSETLKRLDDIGSMNAVIDSLQKMLDEQRALAEQTRELTSRNIGKRPDQMTPQDRKKLEELAAQQAALADATQKAMDRMGKTADQMSKSDPQSAEAMRQAQKQGQRQNISQNQKQASQQMQQNKQSDAKQSQQQAEVGLEMVLNELRAAEKRKLSELQKKLAELQQQIETLIRRQAGHNVDNLNLQGPAVAAAQQEAIPALMEKSGRKAGEAKPELPRLLNGQGQTERNARDIAKKAADLPDGAEPASRVTRAATQMERAAVYLRDRKLTEAYEPPQMEALLTLEDARRLIEEQKAKVDEEIANQEKEAIRQAYVRIKGEQQKLADETFRLEGGRNKDGQLNRADLVRLGQLPTEQQKLIDQIKKVAGDLVMLKSTVYVWANKEIETQMADVKSDLGAQKTGGETQRRHVQVLSDLQAMIDNLKVEPLDGKFESGGGGGGEGGSGGQKPMPPEAELRLMKSLQQAVNIQTSEADGVIKTAGEKTEAMNESLVTIGRRQGQMRTLLNELLSNASKGEMQLGPEPKDGEPLPEEASIQEIDNKELEAELLAGDAGAKDKEIDVRRIGDRMARSRQRLELDRDPGRVTQVIQKRIDADFDLLIEAARSQQCKGGSGSSSPSQQAPQPKPGEQQAQNKGKNSSTPSGQNAAQDSNGIGPNATAAGKGRNIAETAEEWGRIAPRLRAPILESRDETIVERYRRLIEDYTQAVSIEASGGSTQSTTPGNTSEENDTPATSTPAGTEPAE